MLSITSTQRLALLARTPAAAARLPALRHLTTANPSSPDSATSPSASAPTSVAVDVHPAHQQEPLPAEVLSGAPPSLSKRTVRIFRPSNNPMQSGKNANLKWRIDFDALEKGDRWSNPLMGWQSTADPMAPVRLDFASKEDAVHFAEKQGWNHFVQEPHFRVIKPKSYKNNFVYRAGKIPMVHTK